MQTPTTAQNHTAIQGLKWLGEGLNERTENFVMQLRESQHGNHQTGRIESGTIEQTTRIEALPDQLKHWRDALGQERRQCVSHHV